MPTIALFGTAGLILAYDAPLGVEVPALALLGVILRWFMGRLSHRIDELETEVRKLRKGESAQRHRAHELVTERAAMVNTLQLLRRAARRCTCNAMDPVLSLLEEIP